LFRRFRVVLHRCWRLLCEDAFGAARGNSKLRRKSHEAALPSFSSKHTVKDRRKLVNQEAEYTCRSILTTSGNEVVGPNFEVCNCDHKGSLVSPRSKLVPICLPTPASFEKFAKHERRLVFNNRFTMKVLVCITYRELLPGLSLIQAGSILFFPNFCPFLFPFI